MRQPTQLASGFVIHLAFALLFAWFLPGPRLTPAPAPGMKALVWTPRPGFSGGGGGGNGAKASPAPPRPVVRSTPQFMLPHIPAVLGALDLPGAVAVLSAAGAESTGADDGPGKGRGEGLEGPGSGPRTGPGSGAGPLQDGAPGVTSPQVLFEKRPEYTVEAMRARVQGTILIEATVLVDGTVGSVRVVRSLDESFGLDQKAVEAVRGWKFRPGSYFGKPVAVTVLIELSFTLR
ncbi:MAG TPA: energy transducer TonB [Vicinamibacterales bacterium]|nr:energy transducer TonB [Vicinamibacterales bacterium]